MILSPKNLIFENEVSSLYIMGDRTEYEILAYHYPLIGLVQQSDIIIDWKKRVPVRSGILRFFRQRMHYIGGRESGQNRGDLSSKPASG